MDSENCIKGNCSASAGKLCETVVRLIQQELSGTFTPFGQQINNMPVECENFAKTPKTSGNDSLRLVLPKAISLVYTLRNKRGIGHVGGDVDANAIDGVTIAGVCDWIVCELKSWPRLSEQKFRVDKWSLC